MTGELGIGATWQAHMRRTARLWQQDIATLVFLDRLTESTRDHAGLSLADHAKARQRSSHTVRHRLKSLLVKMGVHTQAQLVRKLLLLKTGET